jgi:arabinofuranosyltransferase
MNPRLVHGAALVLLAFAGIGVQSYYWPQIADDSFIFYRYAQNLAAGEGLRWNVGDTPVEGFSSPLWVLVLGLLTACGAPVITASKILGVAAHGLLVIGIGSMTYRLASNRAAAIASMLVAVLCEPLNYWAPSGMETSSYVALLVWSTQALLTQRFGLATALLAVTALARPEAPGMVLVALGLLPFTAGHKQTRARLVKVAAFALLPLLAYLAFRWSYFGEFLPNTYYAKVGAGLQPRLENGLLYIAPAMLIWAGGLLALFLCRIKPSVDRLDLRPLLLVFALATAALIPPLWSGGDWMWHLRFLCPCLPFLIVFVAAITARLSNSQGLVALLPAAIAVIGLSYVGWVNPSAITKGLSGGHLSIAEIQEGRMTAVSQKVADFLRQRGQSTDLVAVNHAGALPYYSQMPTLDMTGLNDHHIAHQANGGLHGKFDPEYVLSKQPQFIVLNSVVKPNSHQELGGKPIQRFYYHGYWAGETALWQHPQFSKEYRFVPQFWTWNWVSPRYILVAERIR